VVSSDRNERQPEGSASKVEAHEQNVEARGSAREPSREQGSDGSVYRPSATQRRDAQDRLLRLAVASARVGSWDWDIVHDHVECSELVAPLYGLPMGEQPSDTAGAFIARCHEDDRARLRQAIQDALSGGHEGYEVEHRVVWPDHSVHWVEVRGHVYRDEQQKPVRMAGTVVDITPRKESQAKLIASEQLMRQLIAHTPAAIAMFDRELRYLQVSQRWLSDYHLEGQELLGRCHYEVFPDVPAHWREVHRRALAGVVERCEEEPYPRQDGTLEWLSWEVRPWTDSTGQVAGIVMFTQVITGRKRSEEALRRAEEKFASIFLAAPVAISITRVADGLLLDVNRQFERLFGYTRDEAIGRTTVQLGMWPDPEERKRIATTPLNTGGIPTVREAALRAKDGRLVPIANSVHPMEHDGELYILSAFTDLSERKRSEAERSALELQLQHAQRLEAVGRLAAGVAHDFNNVLSAITMNSDLLREALAPAHPGLEDVFEIRKAADRAIRLVRQLLAFSRQQVLEPRVLDLNELLANIELMLRRLAGEEVLMSTHFGHQLWSVKADPSQIEQVLVNLAVNARDAMPNGGILSIETKNVPFPEGHVLDHESLAPGEYVALSVTDSGTGMDKETRARMFEPFFTTKEHGRGIGLGLSTVYGIVRQSGGAIDVVSELGSGTRLTVFLPRVHEVISIAPSVGVPELSGGSETILLVEDDGGVRQATRKILVGLGYRLLEAAHPTDAIELVKVYVGPIDLLISDLIMPGKSGRELAEVLKGLRPGLRVLHMSGYSDELAIQQGMLGRGTAFIQKPFANAALANKVRALLDSE
jgi:two-component system, cell cycle sensor histidine kinase and response regulator CckA